MNTQVTNRGPNGPVNWPPESVLMPGSNFKWSREVVFDFHEVCVKWVKRFCNFYSQHYGVNLNPEKIDFYNMQFDPNSGVLPERFDKAFVQFARLSVGGYGDLEPHDGIVEAMALIQTHQGREGLALLQQALPLVKVNEAKSLITEAVELLTAAITEVRTAAVNKKALTLVFKAQEALEGHKGTQSAMQALDKACDALAIPEIKIRIWSWTPAAADIKPDGAGAYNTGIAQLVTKQLIRKLGLPIDVDRDVDFMKPGHKKWEMVEQHVPLCVEDNPTTASDINDAALAVILVPENYNVGFQCRNVRRLTDRNELAATVIDFFEKLDAAGVTL